MGNLSEGILQTTDKILLEKLSLEEIVTFCQHQGFSCAAYQRPDANTRDIIIDFSQGKNLSHLHLDEMGSGFIFHPFSSENHQIKFINCDIHISENKETRKRQLVHSTISSEALNSLFQNFSDYQKDFEDSQIQTKNQVEMDQIQKSGFIELVQKTIGEIQKDKFQKAVIARTKEIELPKAFNSFEFFDSLCSIYQNAFVYISYIPNIGIWLGATPENLININTEKQFQTTALAATQPYLEHIPLEDTTWSQKDIEEQAMVSRYIVNCFKKIRLREFEEVGPRTHLSGNLVHLKTDYKVDMETVAFPQLGTVMLELLHPTSAVCGLPKETSLDFILANEGFDREYYSGFLGPVNMQDETNIFVNLRCMKLLNTHAKLYSGAGIISNSNPEKEWNETEIKMDTLLKALKELY